MKRKLYFSTAILMMALAACNNSAESASASSDTATATPVPAQPAPVVNDSAVAATPVNPTVNLIQLTMKDKLKDDLSKNLVDSLSRSFKYAEYDLNGDGKNEILVGTTGPYFCGSGGCSIYLLDNQGNVINIFSVSDYPVVVDTKKTNGWFDLFIPSKGKHHVMKFDGKKYPSNPSVQPKLGTIPGDDLARLIDWEKSPSYTF